MNFLLPTEVRRRLKQNNRERAAKSWGGMKAGEQEKGSNAGRGGCLPF